jgi:outer membrane protein OmpA-like peptidoglycan-associated protein
MYKKTMEDTMQRTIFALFAILIVMLVATQVAAHPTFYGTEGIFRTYAAEATQMGYLTFGLHGDYAFADEKTMTPPSDSARHHGHINTFLGYAPITFFELGLNAQAEGRYYARPESEDEYSFSFKGLRPIAKIGIPVFEDTVNQISFVLGATGYVNIPWDAIPGSDSTMVSKGFMSHIDRNPSFGALFCVDFNFNVFGLRLNAGSEGPASFKDADNLPGYIPYTPDEPERRFVWGVGVEILTGPYVKFVFEAIGKHCENAMDSMWMTPGIRFVTPVGVTIDMGADFSLQSDYDFVHDYDRSSPTFDPYINQRSKWRPFFGITSSSAIFAKPPPPPKATIAGKVTDAETGEPLAATISFPGSELQSITTDIETGLYKIVVSPGLYRFHVESDGYKWVEKPIRVVKGQTEVEDFALAKKKEPPPPEKKVGILTGRVISSKDKTGLSAKVTVVEKDTTLTTDASTGVYKITIGVGTYTVKAEADDYITDAKPGVVIKKKETTIQNFELTEKMKKGQVITLRGIYFDTGKATIRPESYPVLDDAVRVLKANETVVVEIAGHTDSVGSDSYNMRLSEARANSVRTYLISRGIGPNRLIARGYGETMPVASNATRDGRQMNRRIEFRVLSE